MTGIAFPFIQHMKTKISDSMYTWDVHVVWILNSSLILLICPLQDKNQFTIDSSRSRYISTAGDGICIQQMRFSSVWRHLKLGKLRRHRQPLERQLPEPDHTTHFSPSSWAWLQSFHHYSARKAAHDPEQPYTSATPRTLTGAPLTYGRPLVRTPEGKRRESLRLFALTPCSSLPRISDVPNRKKRGCGVPCPAPGEISTLYLSFASLSFSGLRERKQALLTILPCAARCNSIPRLSLRVAGSSLPPLI